MDPPDPSRLGAWLPWLGACSLVTGCLVFNGKTADEAVDSGPDVSEPDTATAPDPGIPCGANDWCARDTVCCLKLGASGWFGPSTHCGAPGMCGNFFEFSCDTAQGCGDGGAPTRDSCCATRESTTTEFQGSSCVPIGACIPASLAVELCAPAGGAVCPAGQSCLAADAGDLPPGFYACR